MQLFGGPQSRYITVITLDIIQLGGGPTIFRYLTVITLDIIQLVGGPTIYDI